MTDTEPEEHQTRDEREPFIIGTPERRAYLAARRKAERMAELRTAVLAQLRRRHGAWR